MRRCVVDSSVLVKWFNQENERFLGQAAQIFQDLNSDKIKIATPEFSILEVANVLIFGKKVKEEQVKVSISDLLNLPINFARLEDSLIRIAIEISIQTKITVYNAVFISLAKKGGCKLISDDKDHHLKVTDGTVLALKDYPILFSRTQTAN